MTPEQQDRYERARADAEAIYRLRMMETAAIVVAARAPILPTDPPSLMWRVRRWFDACRSKTLNREASPMRSERNEKGTV